MTGSATYHVAQFNWGILIDNWDTPAIADFQDNLDRVNNLAERSPGFVWRLSDDEMEAYQLDSDGPLGGNPRLASTLSVWESAEDLDHFVHNTLHGKFMARGAEWFEKTSKPRLVVWNIPEGYKPTIKEAVERLSMLGDNGPSSEAFDLQWHRKNAVQKDEVHA